MLKNSRVDHNINFGMFYPEMFRNSSGSHLDVVATVCAALSPYLYFGVDFVNRGNFSLIFISEGTIPD